MPLKKARLKISDYRDNRNASVSKNERRIRMVSLSLTSMVDMFAILVIFLLSSQDSDNHMLDFGHDVKLPQSKSSTPPPKAPSIELARTGVYAQQDRLLSLEKLTSGDAAAVLPLTEWFQRQLLATTDTKETQRLNLVADERLPYGTVRRLVALAKKSGFTELNLAVEPTK